MFIHDDMFEHDANACWRFSWLRKKRRRKEMNWQRLKANVILWGAITIVGAIILIILMGSAAPETELQRNFRRIVTRVSVLEKKVESLETHLVAYRANTQYGRVVRSRARERHLNRVERQLRNARFVEKYDRTPDRYRDAPEQENIDIRERRYGLD